MKNGTFLVRLQLVAGDLYLATPIDAAAHPEHPIVLPPPPPDPDKPHPAHPIALPGDPWWPGNPIEPPTEPPTVPSQDCKWVYTEKGWFLVCGPTDRPRPT
jgi:hypothetical protein